MTALLVHRLIHISCVIYLDSFNTAEGHFVHRIFAIEYHEEFVQFERLENYKPFAVLVYTVITLTKFIEVRANANPMRADKKQALLAISVVDPRFLNVSTGVLSSLLYCIIFYGEFDSNTASMVLFCWSTLIFNNKTYCKLHNVLVHT